MRKLLLSLFFSCLINLSAFAQNEQYGPYVGGNVFINKSNLANAHDRQTDSVQQYAFTPGVGAGFDFGYKYENGISISSGLWFGTTNQNYKGKDSIVGDNVTFEAKTTMSFLKIPLMVSVQSKNYQQLKAFFGVGLFYSYNTGFSESAKWDYEYAKDYKDRTMTIDKFTVENEISGDTSTYISEVENRPYRRHGWGAVMAMGLSKQFNKNAEWFVQAKMEYQISNSEFNEETLFTPESGSSDKRKLGHVWGNYAKYMHRANSNYNRPFTHPFNIGVTFGIRYYLFDFE